MTDPAAATESGPPPDTEQFACDVARVMADLRCENVLVLNLRGLSQVTDYFVIGSGTSQRQLNAIVSDLKELARQAQQSIFRSDDSRANTGWAVIDFVDTVAHLMTAAQRAYYDLEGLWGDAPQVNWRDRTRPGQFATLRSAGPRS